MSDPESIVADAKQEAFVAVKEMLDSANKQRCDTPETFEQTQNFLHILQAFYKEQVTVIQSIKAAGEILAAKAKLYENRKEIFRPNPPSGIEDL